MRILFDITHPADVHLFKVVMRRFQQAGHAVLATTRDKDVTLRLLDELGIEHTCLSRMGSGLFGMGRELLQRYLKLLRIARHFRPDVMVARMGISIGPVGMLLRIPRIVIEDSEHAKLQLALSMPFATKILTGFGYLKDFGPRQVRFNSMPVMMYLDPRVFTPNPQVLRDHGLDPDRPYILLRIVSWQAVHDRGLTGASDADTLSAVRQLERYGRVLISSEKPLPDELKQYENPVPVAHMHDLLAFARLCIGEGGTIAAEAAVLGTPAIYCNPLRTGYLLALAQRWELLYNTDSLAQGLEIARELLNRGDLGEQWQRKRQRLLDDSEDASAFLERTITEAAEGRP